MRFFRHVVTPLFIGASLVQLYFSSFDSSSWVHHCHPHRLPHLSLTSSPHGPRLPESCDHKGTLGNDSGTLGNDSGTLGNDSGTLGNDSGTLGVDSGT